MLDNGQGKYVDALVQYRKCLVINVAKLGKDHPWTASSHSCIGNALNRLGKHGDALVELRKGLAIYEATLGRTTRTPP